MITVKFPLTALRLEDCTQGNKWKETNQGQSHIKVGQYLRKHAFEAFLKIQGFLC